MEHLWSSPLHLLQAKSLQMHQHLPTTLVFLVTVLTCDCPSQTTTLPVKNNIEVNVIFISHLTKTQGKLQEKHKTLLKKKTQDDLGFL